MGDDAEYEMERLAEERRDAEVCSQHSGGDLLGVRRSDLDKRFTDGMYCAICGKAGGLVEAAVVDENKSVMVCGECLEKHGEELEEEVEEVEPTGHYGSEDYLPLDLSAPRLIALLRDIERIRQEHELTARLTGENFNVFRILGLSTAEVRTHSAFIAELLKPDGSHGQGTTYLDLFLQGLSIEADAFTAKGAKVKVEFNIGGVNLEEGTGGRIDILLTDTGGRHLVIENKVYAGDQNCQLLRYHNAYPDALLFYLTLDGGKPSDWSKGNKDFPIACISYREHILHWLNDCHKASIMLPVVRETILQYENLIRMLTNQTTGDKVNEDAKKLILAHPEMADAIALLGDAWNAILSQVERIVWDQTACLKRGFPLSNGVVLLRSLPIIDGGGFVIAFHADRGKNIGISDAERRTYVAALQTVQPSSRQNAFWNVGFFNPNPFGLGEGIRQLPKAKVLLLYNKKEEMEKFVNEVKRQADEVTESLLAELKKAI